MKKIGILGSGAVAKALAHGFQKYGYDVLMGARDKSKLKEWQEAGGRVGSLEEAAEFADTIVLTVKGHAALPVLEGIGAARLAGKMIIDVTNPIDGAPPEKGLLRFYTTLGNSQMERLQKAFPQARFVKAFNTIGSDFMVNPDFGGIKPTMFICGNDQIAKTELTQVLDQFGFEVEDMGGVEGARAIEPLCILWCIPGFLRDDWSHAFKLLKK